MNRVIPRAARVMVAAGIALGIWHSSMAMVFVRIPKIGGDVARQNQGESVEPEGLRFRRP